MSFEIIPTNQLKRKMLKSFGKNVRVVSESEYQRINRVCRNAAIHIGYTSPLKGLRAKVQDAS